MSDLIFMGEFVLIMILAFGFAYYTCKNMEDED